MKCLKREARRRRKKDSKKLKPRGKGKEGNTSTALGSIGLNIS
jgi:hypothetical protein